MNTVGPGCPHLLSIEKWREDLQNILDTKESLGMMVVTFVTSTSTCSSRVKKIMLA